jgi:branched-chain amino acid transport system permease protein
VSPRRIVIGAGLAIGLAVLIAVPWFTSAYVVAVMISIMAYTAMTTAWATFSGPSRYISLATSAFFGIGVYCVAVLIERMPLAAALAVAAVVGFAVALVVGLATLRLSGVYFVIFTFGLAELTKQIMIWYEINENKSLARLMFVDTTSEQIYWMLLTLAVATLLIAWLLRRSKVGFALGVIGEDETVARHSGINTTAMKVLVFALTSALMTLAGALMSLRTTYVDPNTAFNSFVSFQVLIMALLGGVGALFGPLLGVVPLVLLSEYLSGSFPYHFNIVLGICFVLIVFFLPHGVAGLLQGWYARLTGRAP